jgi:aspartate/methionine/tyrosine aminotransferase
MVEPRSGWPAQSGFQSAIDLSRDLAAGFLPDRILEAVETSLDQGETHYTDRPGVPGLRQAVAKKLADQQGITVDPGGEVVISAGGQVGVFVGIQVFTNPGDEVIVPSLRPGYVDEAAALAQAKLVPAPLKVEGGFRLQASAVESCLTDKSRVLLLANPANPTGAVLSADEVDKLAALAAKHDLTVIADESLDESLGTEARHTSIAAHPEAAGRTLLAGSFSYLYGLASWRVGFFAGPKELVTPVRDLNQAITICTSAMAQFAALEAMTGPQVWLNKRRMLLDRKRALAVAALDAMGLKHSQPQASPYLMVDISGTGRSSEDFATWLASITKVSVTPGTRFGPDGEGYVRLSLWPSLTEVEQAMRRIAWALGRETGGMR